MATSSLLEVNIADILRRAETIAGTKLPRSVLEVTLEPKLDILCIRFKRPKNGETGEPMHPQVHLFRDSRTNEITAVEVLGADNLRAKAP